MNINYIYHSYQAMVIWHHIFLIKYSAFLFDWLRLFLNEIKESKYKEDLGLIHLAFYKEKNESLAQITIIRKRNSNLYYRICSN